MPLSAGPQGEPGLKLPAGRAPAADESTTDTAIDVTLAAVGTPKPLTVAERKRRQVQQAAAGDYLPASCQGAGCVAAAALVAFAEACSKHHGCRAVFGLEPQGQEHLPG